MKIAFDAKRLFFNDTGLGNYSRTLVANLLDFYPQHDYLLCTPKVPTGKAILSEFRQLPVMTTSSPFRHIWRSYAVRKDLERNKVDIYHGLSNEIPFWLKKTSTIVTIHDVIFKVLPHTYPKLDRWLYEEKTRYACRYAHQVVAVSEHTKQDLHRYFDIPPEKIKVIPPACHSSFYQPLFSQNTVHQYLNHHDLPSQYLLYVGAITERKDLLTLLKAVRLLPDELDVPLVVVGKGKKYYQQARQFVQQAGLSNRVIWKPNIEGVKTLKAIYQNAILTIYPSRYEGFGLPVVESLLCETPVITTNSSSLKEAGSGVATLFEAGNAEQLSVVISDLLESDAQRQQCSTAGRKTALQKYHPGQLTRQWAEIYQKVSEMK